MLCKSRIWIVCVLLMTVGFILQSRQLNGQEVRKAATGQAAVDTRPRVRNDLKKAVSAQEGGTGMATFINGIIWGNKRHDGVSTDGANSLVKLLKSLWYEDPAFEDIPGIGVFLPRNQAALNKGLVLDGDVDSLDLQGLPRWMCLPDMGAFERQDVDLPELTIVSVSPVCEGSRQGSIQYEDVQHIPVAFGLKYPDEWSSEDIVSNSFKFDGTPLPVKIPVGMTAGEYPCKLIVKGDEGCEQEYDFTLQVRKVVTPSAVISLEGSPAICEGDDVSLRISFSGEGPYNYMINGDTEERYFSGVNIKTGEPVTDTIIEKKITESSKYTLVSVRQADGCGEAGTTSGEANVTVVARPTVVLSADAGVCEGEMTPLALKFTGNAPYAYQVSGLDKERVALVADDTIWVAGGAEYTVTQLHAGGCTFDAGVVVPVEIAQYKRPEIAGFGINVISCEKGNWLVRPGGTVIGGIVKDLTPPLVTPNGTIVKEGWLLDDEPITLPYQVKNEDKNKTLSYYAENECGETKSTSGILLDVTNSSLFPLQVTVQPEVETVREYDATLIAAVTSQGEVTGIDPRLPVDVLATANYTTASVGDGKTIVIKYILSGENAGKYAAPARIYLTDGKITKRGLTIDGNAVEDREYDGTVIARIGEGALDGVIAEEDVRCSLSASFGQKDAGNNLLVNVTASWLSGKDCGNYSEPALPTGLTASILKKQLSVTGTTIVRDKAWDGTSVAQVSAIGTLVGVVTGELVALKATAFYDQSDPGTDIRIRVDYALEGETGVLNNYLPPVYNDSFRGSIFKAPAIADITEPEAICGGGTIELTDPEVDDPDGLVIRKWWSLGGVELSTRMPQLTAEDNGKLLCFNIQTSEVVAHSNEVPVTVHALPAIKVSGGGSICAPGDDAFVRIEFTAGTAPFTWYLSGETEPRILESGNSETLIVKPEILTTYRVTAATDANGCVAENLGDEVVVSPGEKPTAIISGDAMICAGGSASVRIDFTGPAPYFYRLTDDVTDRVAYTQTVWTTVTPDNDAARDGVYSKRYQVEYLEANGCLADMAADLRGEATITVNDVKIADLAEEWSGMTGEQLNYEAPEVLGNYTGGYWYLNGEEINMPYTVKASDNGAWLTYRVMNTCGEPVESSNYTHIIVIDGLDQLAITDPIFDRIKNYDGTADVENLSAGNLSGMTPDHNMVSVLATGSYNNAAAAVGKKITVYYKLTGSDKDNYSAPSPYIELNGQIKPLPLTIDEPSAKDKVYDGSVSAEVLAGTLSGVLSIEEGNINAFAQGAFSSKTVGDGKIVNVEYALTGTGIGNYLPPANNTTTANITPRDVRVIGTEVEKEKVWNGTTNVRVIAKGRTEGVVAGDIAGFSVQASYDNANAGIGHTIIVHYEPETVGDGINYRWPADYPVRDAVIIGLPLIEDVTAPGALCAGTEINLPAPQVLSNGGVLTDPGTWLLDGSEIQMPYTVSKTDNGKTLKYKATNRAGVNYSNEVVLTVNALPEVQLTTKAICAVGETARINMTFSGVAPFEYALSDGTAGRLETGNETVAEVNPSAITVYTVTRLTDANCSVEAPDGSATVMVGTYPSAVISGNDLVCTGGEAHLRVDFTGDAPFRFRLAGDTEDRTSDITPAIVTVKPSETSTYTLASAKAGECEIDAANLKGMAKVTLLPAVEASISGDATLCGGEPVEVTLNFSGGTGEYVYRLTGDTSDRYYEGDAAGSTTKVSVISSTTMTYRIESLSSGVCSDLTGNGSATIMRPALPTVGALAELPPYNLPATLDIAAPATENAVRERWLLGMDTIIMPYSLKDEDNGKNLCYVVWNGCGDRAESNSVTVSIPDSPIKPLAVIGTEVETVRSYNGGIEAHIVKPGMLSPDPGGGVTLSVKAEFIKGPNIGEKKVEVVYALGGSDAVKYTSPQRMVLDGRITPLVLDVSDPIVEKSKEYDGTTRVVPAAKGGEPRNVLADDEVFLAVRANYNTRQAGANRKIAVNYTLSGLSSVNYTSPDDFLIADAEIRHKALAVEEPNLRKEKVYDGVRDAIVVPGALQGLIEGDEVRVLASALYDNRNAGESKVITVGYELEGGDAVNYIQPDMTKVVDGKITRLQLGVEATEIAREKSYDGNPSAVVSNPGRLTNAIYSDDVELKVRAEYENAQIGSGKRIDVRYELAGSDADNYIAPRNYSLYDGIISKCPEIAVPEIAGICAGTNLDVARPVIQLNGSTQEGNGWWTLDGEVINMPYMADEGDNGHSLQYHIRTLACGVVSSEEVALTVYKLPVGILSGSQFVCENSNGNINLEVRIFNGEAPYAYRLTGDLAVRPASTDGINYTLIQPHPTVTTRYEIQELRDAKGCIAKDISGEAMVKIVPKPTVSLTGGGTVCEGESTSLVLDFTGEAPFTYAINDGEEKTTYDRHTVVSLVPEVDGDYAVTTLKSGDCAVEPADLTGIKVSVKVNKAPELAKLEGELCKNSGEQIILDEPDITGDILHKGWTLNGKYQAVPWNAIATDHGKTIRFWAENKCGRTESNGLQVLLKDVATPLLLVDGVKITDKIYDGEVVADAHIDMSEARIYIQTMDPADCTLSTDEIDVSDKITLTPTGYFDNPRVGNDHKVIVSYDIAVNTTGTDYIKPKETEHTGAAILAASLTLEAPELTESRPYDATTRASVTAGAINSANVAMGDEVSATATAAFRDKNVGVDKPVKVQYQLIGRAAGNYILDPATQTVYEATITPIPLTMVGEQIKPAKRYNGDRLAEISRQGTVSGVIVGDRVDLKTEAKYDSPEVGERIITVSFKRNSDTDDGGNYTLPVSYLLSGKIYDIPDYITPMKGVNDELCVGNVLYPEAPGYRLNEATLVSEGWTIRRNGISSPLRAPYKVSLDDNGAILRYVVRNSAGYGEDGENNTKTLVVNDKPAVAHTLVGLPAMEQMTELLVPAQPDITGKVTAQGWALVTRDQDIMTAEPLTLPYTVTLEDNGKYLVYWAENSCGRAESNRVALNIYKLYPVQLYADVMFESKKRFDGNAEAKVLSVYNVRGVENAHVVNVSAKATYDSPETGENKLITVTFDLLGKDADKYVAPVDYVIDYGWIYDRPSVEAPADPGQLCAGDTINIDEPLWKDNAAMVVKTGWSLGSKTITMPHIVQAEDRGKLLSFWAVNTEGLGENQITLDVRPRPTVSMPKDTVINVNGVATVIYQFSGTAPFTYTLKDGRNLVTSPSQSSYVEKVTPEHAQYYGVNALSDAYCKAWVADLADSMFVQINGDNIRIMVGDTIFVYDGDPKTLEVRAEPEDRTDMLEVYYDGSTARPYAPGTYPTSVKFAGDWQFGPLEKKVTVIIEKAYAEVFIDNLKHLYDGRQKQADVTSDPDGLNLKVTYNDTTALPVASGQYRVHAEVVEDLWQGSADALLLIDEYIDQADMINTIEVRGDNNTKFLVKDYERYSDMKVKIFDRGGKLIYKSDNYAGYEYDMRDLRAGTYYYVLTYRNEGREETRRGAVTVIK